MNDTTTPKPKPAPKAAPTPAEALDAAVATLVAAAEAYAAADGTTTHSYVAGDYRVRFQGEQLLSLARI
jgi:hypothetical protein